MRKFKDLTGKTLCKDMGTFYVESENRTATYSTKIIVFDKNTKEHVATITSLFDAMDNYGQVQKFTVINDFLNPETMEHKIVIEMW